MVTRKNSHRDSRDDEFMALPPASQRSFSEKLDALARNYWWCWQPEVVSIFRDLDPVRWRQFDHNPILLLDEFTHEQLELRGREAVLHSRVNYAYRRWQEYMGSKHTWGDTHAGLLGNNPVAYFSAEFGIHESLPNYSGGLGVLAGDHLKSASDQECHWVAVGLFYQEGYFLTANRRDRMATRKSILMSKTRGWRLKRPNR